MVLSQRILSEVKSSLQLDTVLTQDVVQDFMDNEQAQSFLHPGCDVFYSSFE
jgi:hypothetical protein